MVTSLRSLPPLQDLASCLWGHLRLEPPVLCLVCPPHPIGHQSSLICHQAFNLSLTDLLEGLWKAGPSLWLDMTPYLAHSVRGLPHSCVVLSSSDPHSEDLHSADCRSVSSHSGDQQIAVLHRHGWAYTESVGDRLAHGLLEQPLGELDK